MILSRGNVEIMYQSRESVAKDIPALRWPRRTRRCRLSNAIYIEVSDIDDVEKRLAGMDLVVPRRHDVLRGDRDRCPGARREPIVFAQQARGDETAA